MNEYRSMNLSQMASHFGVSVKTVKKWIKPLENQLGPHGDLFTPRQVAIIMNHLE